MKMITAIVHKEDAKKVCTALIKKHFSITRLASTGGFLMAGNMTLLLGVEDDQVEDCLSVLRECCSQHTEVVPAATAAFGIGGLGVESPQPMQVTVGGAIVFVTNVERFEKL